MKNLFYILISLILIVSCTSSTKMLHSGDYDSAIHKSVKKIKRKRSNDKEIMVLEAAFRKANNQDIDRITFLKKEGSPDSWDEITNIYWGMCDRQELVKPLLPLKISQTGRIANIEIVNYDNEVIQAKQKAAEYFYIHGLKLLESGSKSDARKAYTELQNAKRYYTNFKDVDNQLQKAKFIGTSFVLFKMENKTGILLPPTFEEELVKIGLSDLNKDWLIYHAREDKTIKYDYTILVNMKNINVSPESVKEIQYTETKEIPDGFQYILDDKGNVKKDAQGNDIKIPKNKTITCSVLENYQFKKAIIAGTLDYINNNSGQLIKTDPIAAENFFEHRAATAMGDVNALKPETKAKIGQRPVPFPPDFDMLFRAGQTLKDMVKNIIWSNRSVW